MNKSQRNIWLLVAFMCAIAVTIYALSYIVTEPWRMLPDIGGEGAKNDFTYLYHSLYGHGYWFQGMNYPYGEHIVFTDGQPLLSVLFTHFKGVTAGQVLTVLWWLIGFSYILAIVFVYRILVYFKVLPLLSVIFASCIVIMCPQTLSLTGHYSLAYNCVMPMLFYWTLLYHEHVRWRYCIWVFLLGIVTAFLHPYYMAMMLVWVMSYSLGYFIFTKQNWRGKAKHVLPLLAACIAVFLLVSMVMKITDPVVDRPQSPFADREMYTTPHKLFTSYYSPAFRRAIDMGLIKRVCIGGEGFAYIGIVTTLTVFISLLIFAARKLKKRKSGDMASGQFSPIWLFIAGIVLLLSMGIPFIFNMEWLMDYLSVFKQFRALGRFSWIFYYVVTIYSAVTIYSWHIQLTSRRKMVYGYSLLVFSLTLWVYEARGYIRFTRELSKDAAYNYDVMYSKYEQNWESFLQEKHYKRDDFQAIILLPFFHVGTEKLWIGDPGWLITLGVRGGLQLHLPIVDVMMSRSSWSVAQKQVKIAGGPFADKPILRDIKSSKPFLLFTTSKDSLAFDQNYLLLAADYIGDFSSGKVYALYPDRLVANDKKYADSVNRILPYMTSADTFISNTGTRYINHFDARATGDHLFGTGAAPYLHQDSALIATIPVEPAKASQPYEFSCWFLLRKEDYKSPEVQLRFLDNAGNIIGKKLVATNQSMDSYGMWFRASLYFNMPAGCGSIKCILHDAHEHSYVAMDEMLLRPAGALVISKAADGSVMVNNHLFKTVKQ